MKGAAFLSYSASTGREVRAGTCHKTAAATLEEMAVRHFLESEAPNVTFFSR
jgi:hypothetical protein